MPVIDPKNIATKDLHQYLVGSVAPRPIALVSTVDAEGNPNLAPYSFFNAFSSNPPILVFSSNRRVTNNTTKDTLANVQAIKEVVIGVVTHDIVRQMAITSVEFPKGVSEFKKGGFTPIPAQKVKPNLIKESPVNMECVVKDIITLGTHGGAGHLVLCEVVLMHIDDRIVENNRINPHKIDLMGRMGRAHYTRASGDAIHTIVQSVVDITIGYDQLPDSIKQSKVLSANNLGQLSGLTAAPTSADVAPLLAEDCRVKVALQAPDPIEALHQLAKEILADDKQRAYGAKIAWIPEYL